MDLKKIFLKDACPTSIGGQAIMEGIMIFLMKLLTVIAYILAMLSPFILIAWFFVERHNKKQREKRWNESMRN